MLFAVVVGWPTLFFFTPTPQYGNVSPAGHIYHRITNGVDDHLWPCIKAAPWSTLSMWRDISSEAATNTIFLVSGNWVVVAAYIQRIRPDVESVSVVGQNMADFADKLPAICTGKRVLVNFMDPPQFVEWAERYGAACTALGGRLLPLTDAGAVAMFKTFSNNEAFTPYMVARHPRYAIQQLASPQVPCVVKDVWHEGNGRGARC
jgi:hypothetical protein